MKANDLKPMSRRDLDKETQRVMKGVLEQREEILQAFVAKYGFNPDECEQIVQGSRWFVVRLDPERARGIEREVILARLRRKKFTLWQQFCLALAGIRT